MNEPILENCFNCGEKVFQLGPVVWGCDTCKSVWKWKNRVWVFGEVIEVKGVLKFKQSNNDSINKNK